MFFDVQVMASALHAWHDVRPVLVRALPVYVLSVALVAALQYALLTFAQRVLGGFGRTLPFALTIAALGGLFGAGPRHATPEVRAAHALTALGAKREARSVASVTLPPLLAERAELPNLLFILSESIRASDYRGGGDHPTAPLTAALTRGRTDLAQMRAVSSYTAVSLSAILTGHTQEGPRDAILRSPSLFDFAHATRDGRGARPFVAYFSSQPASVFETEGVHAAVDRFASIETVRGHDVEGDTNYADLPLDRDIVDLFEKAVPELPSPSVTMLHLVGTHAPYFVDPQGPAPFQPYDHVVTWARMPKLLNAYLDSIVEQDRTLARAVRAFIEHSGAHPWIIVFTSDHGESFGEHGAIHHGQNLMDEQIHVPGWIAASDGAFSVAQSRALADQGPRFLTHLDLLPTMLDALGLLDDFAVVPYRAAMPGRSLLRPLESQPRAPVPVTNCTSMFPCPLNTWGMLDDDRKLVSQVWDGGWTCTALSDGEERVVQPFDDRCDRLRSLSQRTFPLLPNGSPNR
jgi:hypothetical protein